jgi:Tfp pilus assembly protein PilF
MSYVLSTLGRGLIGDLFEAVRYTLHLPAKSDIKADDDCRTGDAADEEAQTARGFALLATHEHSDMMQAANLFAHAATLDPDNPRAQLGLACVEDRLGQHTQAARYLDRVLEQWSDNAVLWLARGLLAEKQDTPAKAKRAYRRALQACPGLRNARERLAALALNEGDYASGVEHYRHL